MAGVFEGKVAIVTGGAGGIGEAIARDLAKNGAKVLVVDMHSDAIEPIVRAIREQNGIATGFAANVADLDQCQATVDMAVRTYGGLHLAVNNAGISGKFNALPDVSVEDWRRVMGVNVDGVFFGMKCQLPAIEKSGGGAVVNTASIYGHLGLNRLDAYTASKHAVLGLTRSVAIEYATRGVRINAVSPGPIWTPLTRAHPDQTAPIVAQTAMKRMGEPVEIAKAVTFLLSPDASFITGSEVVVDGGVMLS